MRAAKKIQCSHCGAIRMVSKTSNHCGVDKHIKGKWRARVTAEGETIHIGYFTSEQEAAAAYDDYILENGIVNRPLNYPTKRWSLA